MTRHGSQPAISGEYVPDQDDMSPAAKRDLEELVARLQALNAALDAQRQAAEASEEQLSIILESLTDGFFAVDRDLRFTYINSSAERMWNRHREGLLGWPVAEVLPEIVTSSKYQAMLTALEEDQAVSFEERSVLHNAWVSGRAYPTPRGVAVTFQDISARLSAEQARDESEARYRLLFSSIDVGFCTIEMIYDEQDDPVDFRFLETNPAFHAHTGLSGAVGKRMRELVADHEEFWFTKFSQVDKTGEPARFESRAEAMNRWFDVYAFRIGNSGNRQVAILFTDTSERKRQEQVQQDFVGMVSHDLSNPLTVLRGWAQLLRRRKSYEAGAVDAIIEQTQRMERLVSDLRDFVMFETSEIELRPTLTDLVELAHTAAGRARMQSTQHVVTVRAPDEPIMGTYDRDRISQVLDNLIGNSLKHSPSGAEIVITVERAGNHARFQVIDQGPGIPAQIIPRLFERFYRAESAGATKGLGLGLFISRMLVEAHGGQISAESTLGQGSTFTVALPLTGPPLAD